MLSEKAIDKLIQPIIDRQEALTDYIIKLIARRVKETGHLLPSDVYSLERLMKRGADVQRINEKLAELTNLQVRDIKRLIKLVAKDAYLDAKPFYDYRHKPFIPFEENVELQRVVKAISDQTTESYTNLARARAFMIRDIANPKKLIPTPITKTYYSVIDEAVQASQSGAIDYHTAMRRTIEQLADSGIKTIQYQSENGKVTHQSMESAVKRNILEGVRAINQGVQDEMGKQFGADGKEITVHEYSAEDHEPVQGHQFTNEEYEKLQSELPFEDVNGKKFAPIERHIGQYNCHHYTYSIIVGVNKPIYTQKQLDENIARNHKGYTDSKGKHKTIYECTQYQRKLERDMRKAKRTVMAGKASGDEALASKGKAKLDRIQKAYKDFSKKCGLKPKFENTRVDGYED